MTAAQRLWIRAGALEDAIMRLAAGTLEDEMTLALFHQSTPPDETCFATEDECAAFVASAHRALTAKQAELEGLREELAGLEAQVPA